MKDPLHAGYRELAVVHDGKEYHYINKNLLDQQLCWENLDAIKELHTKRIGIYIEMVKTDDAKKLKEFDKECTDLEFELQDLWKFDRDVNYHRFWDRPQCACPTMDNEDSYPIGYYITNGNCLLHGDVDEEKGI